MRRIVLVDDHEVARRGVRQILADGFPGATIEEADGYDAGHACLSRGPVDLVVLDLNLKGRSGLELLEESRRRWPALAVVVLSAYPEAEYAARCLQAGASAFLAKDSTAAELLLAARRALEGRRYVGLAQAERLAGLLGGAAAAPHEALSARELEVLRLVAGGLSLREIGARLHVSESTVATYRARLSAKLGLSTLVELTRYAVRNRLVE